MILTTERLIIIVLLILLVVATLIILKKSRQKDGSFNEDIDSRGSVSRETHRKVLRERDDLRDKLKKINSEKGEENFDIQEKYDNIRLDNEQLKRRIEELTRDNNELRELLRRDSVNNLEDNMEGNNSIDSPSQSDDVPKGKKGYFTVMYASFPRSVGSSIYFSDLTDKLADDSYFELRISGDIGKASFRPLDFMKIRNYDPAMAVILTEGVKPNVASTVVGVEPGEACLEGNDWIIKNLAKVKLV